MTPSSDQTLSVDDSLAGKVSLVPTMALLVAVYLGLRLPSLLALPLFNDEAVYLVRAQFFPAMLGAAGVAGGTLPDGKLLHELALAALAPLPVDPLIPARLLNERFPRLRLLQRYPHPAGNMAFLIFLQEP